MNIDREQVIAWARQAFGVEKAESAIVAIEQAKRQQALDKMAENERELGIQMQPEPVAWGDLLKEAQQIVRGKFLWKKFIDGTPLANDIPVWMADFAQQYTPPAAQRQWVGLTDDEYLEAEKCVWAVVSLDDTEKEANREFYRAIEAKLREKNGGAA